METKGRTSKGFYLCENFFGKKNKTYSIIPIETTPGGKSLASIYSVARYGIVGDLCKVIPGPTEEIKAYCGS